MPDATLSPVADTYINRRNTTLNYAGDTELVVGGLAFNFGGGVFARRSLLDFDLSGLDTSSGVYIGEALLHMTVSADGGGANNGETPALGAHRVLQDVVITEATWIEYSSGNDWLEPGGQAIGTDVTVTYPAGDVMLSNTPGTVYTVDIAALLNETRECGDDRLVAMVHVTQSTAHQNAILFASMNHATSGWHPYLEVTYAYAAWSVGYVGAPA